MNTPSSASNGMRGVPLGADADVTQEAVWTSIVTAEQELRSLMLRSSAGITTQEALDAIRRSNKITAHAEWAMSLLIEDPQ